MLRGQLDIYAREVAFRGFVFDLKVRDSDLAVDDPQTVCVGNVGFPRGIVLAISELRQVSISLLLQFVMVMSMRSVSRRGRIKKRAKRGS